MSLQISACATPSRRIALTAPSGHALVFELNNDEQELRSSQPFKCKLQFLASEDIDLSAYRPLALRSVHGTLGLINVGSDVYLCVITQTVRVAEIRPNETVYKILAVDFHNLSRQEHGLQGQDGLGRQSAEYGYQEDNIDFEGGDYSGSQVEHPCTALKKLLSDGTFFYSENFDLTNRLQSRWVKPDSGHA